VKSTFCKSCRSRSYAPLPQHHRVIVERAARPKIGLAAQRTKDIANIIRSVYPSCERRVPPLQDAFHDFNPRQIDIPERGLEAPLVGIEEVDRVRFPRIRAIEIRSGAHDDDAAEVGEVVDSAAQQRLERGVVLLRSGAVNAGTVREELCGVGEGLTEERPAEVDVRGGDVAAYDAGGLAAGCVGGCLRVVGTVGDCGGGVVQVGGAGEADGELAEGLVDFEDFGAVDGLGVFGWEGASLGHVSSHCVSTECWVEDARCFFRDADPVVKLAGISRASNSYCNATWTA